MSTPVTQLPGARLPAQRFVGVALALLVIALPALLCGVGIDAPVTDAEVARLRAALADPEGLSHGPAMLFYGWMAPEQVGADLSLAVHRARLAVVLGVLAISCMLYAIVALVRSRTTALLACLAFAAHPASQVVTLRPEVPATMFGLLATLLLAGVPAQVAQRRRRSWSGHAAVMTGLVVAVGIAAGLAVGSLADHGVFLLVPGAVALLALVVAGAHYVAMFKRWRHTLYPFHAFTRRTAPWFCAGFAAMAGGAVLLRETETSTVSSLAVLPDPTWLAALFVLCAIGGGFAWALRVGLVLGRRLQIDPDTVLFCYVTALLIQAYARGGGVDPLAAVTGLAVVTAIGARMFLVLGVGYARRVLRPSG